MTILDAGLIPPQPLSDSIGFLDAPPYEEEKEGTSCSSNIIAGICKLMHFSNQLCGANIKKLKFLLVVQNFNIASKKAV